MMTINRTYLTFGILAAILAAILASLLTFTFISTPAAQAQPVSNGVQGMRQITVVGQGEARGVPDTARVEIGVETSAPTTAEAIAQNTAQVQAVIDRVKALGVAERDIQTSNFNMYARYDSNGQTVVGYTVSNMVSVTIRDLARTGALLDEVVQVGANLIYGITFQVADSSALLQQSREQAMQNARDKASQLAQQAGATLGDVLLIEEYGDMGVPMPVGRGGGGEMAEAAVSVPVQAGEQAFSSSVQVTFELR